MDWQTPFIIYRITEDGKWQEVYYAADMQKAKYWLTYIAQPGDVLCRTPSHPKHSKQSKSPEYWCHKETSGTPSSTKDTWLKLIREKNASEQLPEEQMNEAQPEA